MREQVEKITIQAFRAVDHREQVIRYILEHQRVLQDIGVSSALKLDYGWCMDPETVLIVAVHEELGMVGGCRIEFAQSPGTLPICKYLRALDAQVDDKLAEILAPRTGELAGLWVAHRFSRRGIPWYLTAAAVAILDQVNAGVVLCFAAEYSRKYAMHNGFEVLKSIGDNGRLDFPTPGISSYALVNRNAPALENATGSEKLRLLSLRSSPEQVRLETAYDHPLEVTYSLHIKPRLTPLIPLQSKQQLMDIFWRRTA